MMKLSSIMSFLFLSLSLIPLHGADLRLEVHCLEDIKRVKKSELCGEGPCSWNILSSSEYASVWSYGVDKSIVVREVPNRKILRVTFSKAQELSLPWCKSVGKLSLKSIPKATLKVLKEAKESLYLLPKKGSTQGNLLKSIDHPCRKLKSKDHSDQYSFFYLLPSQKKSCQKSQPK